jgi:hypothetical protein
MLTLYGMYKNFQAWIKIKIFPDSFSCKISSVSAFQSVQSFQAFHAPKPDNLNVASPSFWNLHFFSEICGHVVGNFGARGLLEKTAFRAWHSWKLCDTAGHGVHCAGEGHREIGRQIRGFG